VNDLFLLCRQCEELHPVCASTDDDDAALDFAEFRAAHAGHGLSEARRVPDSALFDAPTWDPMATRWFSVAVGSELLHVRSWRTSIDEPRRHQLARSVPSSCEMIDVDTPLLRRALDRHFYPHALRPIKVERFVDMVNELLATLDPGAAETSFDDPTEANASIGPFPPALCEVLLDRCTPIFDTWEMGRVGSFIEDHRFEDGALAIRVRRILARSAA